MRILTVVRRAAMVTAGDRGATAAEYALLAALIAIVIIVAVALLGTNLVGLYDEAASSL